jgi:F0F1-type ATP synthase assembly protein I
VKPGWIGLTLTVVIGAVSAAAWGRNAALTALLFGAIATGIQVFASRLMANQTGKTLHDFMGRWAIGTALRFGGAILLMVVALLNPMLFPPLAAGLGFLGVLIPLLFLEVRTLR